MKPKYFQNLTANENLTLSQINQFQEKYLPLFVNQSFPGLTNGSVHGMNEIDWIINLLTQNDADSYIGVYALQSICEKFPNISCFEVLMDPPGEFNTESQITAEVRKDKLLLSSLNFTKSFNSAFAALWHAKLPCFDTVGMTALKKGQRGILNSCTWKGRDIPCSAIFTTFPTDKGMCCSFNIKAADKILAKSQYTTLVKQLQNEDSKTSFEDSLLPEWYTHKKEPKSQPGLNMGLVVILDAHSDAVESLSISSDFEGFKGLITDSGSYPLTNLGGFAIKPGHNNLVAVSAVKIDADDDLKNLKPAARKCFFPDEIGNLTLFQTYSQANCFLECSLKFAQNQLKLQANLSNSCTPWNFPMNDNHFQMCDPFQSKEIRNFMQTTIPDCNYCMPDCTNTIYTQSVSTQQFRRCDERNLLLTPFCSLMKNDGPYICGAQVIETYIKKYGKVPPYMNLFESGKRSIKVSTVLNNFFEDLPREYDAFEKDIAVLNVFFDSNTVLNFKSQKRQSWIGYFSNVGGSLGLCTGLSIVTIVELFWLFLTAAGFCRRKLGNPDEVRSLN